MVSFVPTRLISREKVVLGALFNTTLLVSIFSDVVVHHAYQYTLAHEKVGRVREKGQG